MKARTIAPRRRDTIIDARETRVTSRIPRSQRKGTQGQTLRAVPRERRAAQLMAYAGPRYDLGSTVRIRNCTPEQRGPWELVSYIHGAEELTARVHRGGLSIEVHPSRIVLVQEAA